LVVAAQIVTGRKPQPGIMDGIIGASGERGSGNYNPTNHTEVTPNQKAIGNVLGITDTDRKTYEDYLKTKKINN
jgi:hypothetical protein